ncbi:1,4-alpha-glucan branching protein [Schaalia canis]|uniref:1,4-alpha-glucan branching protein n=1 Tax=Schaalia canis TaxID=100469 RepID=A0A3P1SER1_9ACTO|nr:1,4-alpha-glucan branching protein [Schaalia canis]RRC95506.1 1,4-alpha-glucan branching protein [Schaalia canis]
METGHDTVATRLPTRAASWPSDAEILTALGPWMYERRWYPLKDGGAPTPESMTVIADVELAPHVRDLLIAVTRLPSPAVDGREDSAAASAPVLVHVPLVLENADALASFALPGEAAAAAGFILPSPPPAGVITPAEAGRGVALVDGARHPAFWAAWAEGALRSGNALNEADARAILERSGAARVMTGEQSNTNVVMRAPAESETPDLVAKLFRVLSPGPNPDVEVSRALAAHGWDRVRRPVAWSTLSWVDPSTGEEVHTHSAVATTFIPEAHDGFELFCALAAEDAAEKTIAEKASSAAASGTGRSGTGRSGTGRSGTGSDTPSGEEVGSARHRATTLARDLGATTAQMHKILALACGEHQPDSPARFVDTLRQRAAWALEEVPALHEQIPGLAGKIAHVYARIDACDVLEPATRIHGDYHLGQVLREKIAGEDAGSDSDSGRWFVLDFEGEPLRPLAQRLLPDQPLRDVAGMLRSFDYAAAVGASADSIAGSHTASDWLAAVRAAFLEGYEAELNADLEGASASRIHGNDALTPAERRRALLTALELDKALYEAVYEARNRPDWLEIPLRGVKTLVK